MGAPFTFYEFFAGGGMARAGLGEGWRCLFANDFDRHKAEVYRANWGDEDLDEGDVWAVTPDQLPGRADLAWASSPCQDLSLAGRRAGLSGARSSAFWGFWRLMEALAGGGRAPRTVVIENVVGLLSSHDGADFAALCAALDGLDYRFGALDIDAAWFLPQSRPRLFVVGVRDEVADLREPASPFHTRRLVEAVGRLPAHLRSRHAWWALPAPPARNADLASVVEPDEAVAWHTRAKQEHLLSLLAPLQQARLDAAVGLGQRLVGALYRRTRAEAGRRMQRAELRFDGVAGCLRTPGGGSSRQFIVVAENGLVRTRPLTAREGARLLGLPDSYRLPGAATRGLHVAGDGVAAPVVRWLARHLLEPSLQEPALLAAE